MVLRFFKLVALEEFGMRVSLIVSASVLSACALLVAACSDSDDSSTSSVAHVQIKNDFNNPDASFQPPWTICKSSYQGVQFGKIEQGATSAPQDVPAGIDYVLMVAAWKDPSCDPSNSLPIATKNLEEVVEGQTRTIAVGLTNHQGSCPPEGVQPIPEEQYDRILQLWPEFGFKPYAERTTNSQCLPDTTSDGGADVAVDSGADAGSDANGDASDQ